MTKAVEKFTEREEIEMLLPWYVSGRLDAGEHERVERFLAQHPDMEMQLRLIGAEQDETITSNEAIGGAPAGAIDRLRQSVAAEGKRLTFASIKQSIWGELTNLFTLPTPRAVQWAGIAAAIVIVAQAAMIGGLMNTGKDLAGGVRYQTASGGQSEGTRVLVQFAPALSNVRLSEFLRAEKAEIVAGPKPGGIYEVRISARKLSQSEIDNALKRLKASKDMITLIMPGG